MNIKSISVNEKLSAKWETIVGDIIKIGRYKGSISNENLLLIEGDIDDILNFLLLQKESSMWGLFENITFTINVEYESQCNFELLENQIEKLFKLNIPIGISCYTK